MTAIAYTYLSELELSAVVPLALFFLLKGLHAEPCVS